MFYSVTKILIRVAFVPLVKDYDFISRPSDSVLPEQWKAELTRDNSTEVI